MAVIKVAVIGGGIAGTTLANGLMKHPDIDFDVYEAGPAFKERGASVGLNGPCQRALELIGNNVRKTIDRAGGVVCASTRLYVGEGPERGRYIVDFSDKDTTMNVHRVEFLRELLEPVPESRLHANKKLVRIEELANPSDQQPQHALRVHFADGTHSDVDAVLGCDGIHSTVRKHVLGANDPNVAPKFAGFWDFRNLVPAEMAREKMGAEFFDAASPRQIGWVGTKGGGFVLHQLIDDGRTAAIIVAGKAEPNAGWEEVAAGLAPWKRPLAREQLERLLGDRGDYGRGVADCIMQADTPLRFSQWNADMASTYARGSVLMLGDAAHATTPWHGSGAGFAIEDAAALQALLAQVRGPSELPAAFQAFDRLRRPRTQKLIRSSLDIAHVFCGVHEEIGLDWDRMAEYVPRAWEFIYDIDMQEHVDQGVEMFRRLRDGKELETST